MSDVRVPDLNIVLIAGRVVREPDFRTTPSRRSVARFTIAHNRRYRMKDGSFKEETVFANIVVWDRQAEYASQQLRKGRPVLVEGRLRLDEWEDRATGQRRSRLEIVAWRVSPLDWVPAEGESFDVEEFPPDEERGSYPDASPNQGKVPPQNNINHFPEDDVPF